MQHELEEVISWLEAGEQADYQAGVLLFQRHSSNRGLVSNLLKKESTNNRQKLHYELVKVGCGGRMQDVSEVLNHFAQAVPPPAPAPMPPPAAPQEDPALAHVPASVQAEIDDLTQLMSQIHGQRVKLSNSLATLDPAEGPRVVPGITTLNNQYNALAQKRRLVLARGEQVPAAPAPAPEQPAAAGDAAPALDRAELVKQRGNLRSNLSKAKKKAEEAKTEEKRSEYAQKAAKLEVELGQVEMQLAQPQA